MEEVTQTWSPKLSEPARKSPQSSEPNSSTKSGNGSRPKPRPPTAGKPGGNGSWSKKNKLRAKPNGEAASHTHISYLEGVGVPPTLDELAGSLDPFDHTPEGRAKRQAVFLLALQEFGTIKAGCRACNISRTTYIKWIEDFPEFKEATENAFMDVGDDLEEEVFRRGKNGSDGLLMFAVKRFKPEYRDNFKPDDGKAGDEEGLQQGSAADAVKSRIKSLQERRSVNLALPAGETDDVEVEDDIPKPRKVPKKKGWD